MKVDYNKVIARQAKVIGDLHTTVAVLQTQIEELHKQIPQEEVSEDANE